MKKDEKSEVFYVGINSPTEVRRDVLENTKVIIIALKTFENFKEARVEKTRHVENLKVLMSELDMLFNKLKRVLPQTRVREKPSAIQIVKKDVEVRLTTKKMSEIEKLESELSNIEEKLNRV